MRQIRGTKRFIAGFIAAFVVCELPLSASIAPLQSELVSPLATPEALPTNSSINGYFKYQPAQVNSELDLKRFAELESQFENYIAFKTEKYIPTTMKTGASQSEVTREILQTSVQTWLEDSDVRNTNVGRSAISIQEGLSTEIVSKSKNGHIQSLKFRLQPITTVAQVIIQGQVNATIAYDIDDSDLNVKVYKQIGDTEYSLQHKTDDVESKNTLNLAWSF